MSEERYEEAAAKFQEASSLSGESLIYWGKRLLALIAAHSLVTDSNAFAFSNPGFHPHVSYNLALCRYRLKEYGAALKHIADIIERGIRDHPELSVGMATEGIDVRSVGNTRVLHETALVEAFNLKAAIEYDLRNCEWRVVGR